MKLSVESSIVKRVRGRPDLKNSTPAASDQPVRWRYTRMEKGSRYTASPYWVVTYGNYSESVVPELMFSFCSVDWEPVEASGLSFAGLALSTESGVEAESPPESLGPRASW